MKTIHIGSWVEFEPALAGVAWEREKLVREFPRRGFQQPRFRGHGSTEWLLNTTLERSQDVSEGPKTLMEYYRRVYEARPMVETISNESWHIPEPDALDLVLKHLT